MIYINNHKIELISFVSNSAAEFEHIQLKCVLRTQANWH